MELLIDPTINNQSMGYWDNTFNLAYIFGKGFLRKNQRIPGDFRFTFDPEEEAFPEPKRGEAWVAKKILLKIHVSGFSCWEDQKRSPCFYKKLEKALSDVEFPYFTGPNLQESESAIPIDYVPSDDSDLQERFLFCLLKLDEKFQSGIVTKIDVCHEQAV